MNSQRAERTKIKQKKKGGGDQNQQPLPTLSAERKDGMRAQTRQWRQREGEIRSKKDVSGAELEELNVQILGSEITAIIGAVLGAHALRKKDEDARSDKSEQCL